MYKTKQLNLFWDAFAKAYTGQDDHSEFDRQAGQHEAEYGGDMRYGFAVSNERASYLLEQSSRVKREKILSFHAAVTHHE